MASGNGSVAHYISLDLDRRQFKLQRRKANDGFARLTTARPEAPPVRAKTQGFRLILQQQMKAADGPRWLRERPSRKRDGL
jgi:hypothetical protein